jgi:hypothetical protein
MPASALASVTHDAGQRLVAGVRDRDVVGDQLTRRVGNLARYRRLDDVQARVLGNRNALVVAVRVGLIAVGEGGVVQVAIATTVAVDLGLRHRVLRGVAPGLAHFEVVVVVANEVGVAHDARIGLGIRDHDAGQRLVDRCSATVMS